MQLYLELLAISNVKVAALIKKNMGLLTDGDNEEQF